MLLFSLFHNSVFTALQWHKIIFVSFIYKSLSLSPLTDEVFSAVGLVALGLWCYELFNMAAD